MSPLRFLRSLPKRLRAQKDKAIILRQPATSDMEIARERWSDSLSDPTTFYSRCVRYFHQSLPEDLRAHRLYFSKEQRGFGEEAFHVMWWMLFQEFRPGTFLEIGVYRGQTLSLAALLQRHFGIEGTITGISPFASAGDAVSRYRGDVNYQEDTLANFRHFSLAEPDLHKCFSTDPDAVSLISSREWDCVYIDGNHDYEVALADWKNCSAAVVQGGIVVLDDSALGTDYRPPAFATGGHPGPSRVAEEIDRSRFQEILRVGHNRVFQKL